MRSRSLWSVVFALSAGLSAAAQVPAAGAPAQPRPVSNVNPSAPITVSGCLKVWVADATTPLSPAAARKAGDPQWFTLTQVDSVTPSIQASNEASPKPTEVRLLLIPSPGLDLSKSVHSRVKVTGTIEPESVPPAVVGTSGTVPAPTAPGPVPESTKAHSYQTMKVSAAEPLKGECTQ
jgi:hypothetical protein